VCRNGRFPRRSRQASGRNDTFIQHGCDNNSQGDTRARRHARLKLGRYAIEPAEHRADSIMHGRIGYILLTRREAMSENILGQHGGSFGCGRIGVVIPLCPPLGLSPRLGRLR
jgi:hypothetical protein